MTTVPAVARATTPWLLRPVPDDATSLLFTFPYAGVGASAYRDWPGRIGPVAVCPLQPPGRENRFREPALTDHAAFAGAVVDVLAGYRDRPYAFFGHCGAVPYMLDTVLRLVGGGAPPPTRIIASAWGAPQRGLYGRLNFVDLDTFDPAAEVLAAASAMGRPMSAEIAELAGEVLLLDLEIQRGYRFAAGSRVPCPVTVVGWSDDDVVPDATVHDGWDECGARLRHVTLPGRHFDFLALPDALRDLLTDELTGRREPAREVHP